MNKEAETLVDFGNGKTKIFKYTLSNNIEEINKAIQKRTGIDIPDLNDVEWELNTGLSENVKAVMNDNNVNYSMTTDVDGYVQHIWVNKRSVNEWYLFYGTIVRGKFNSKTKVKKGFLEENKNLLISLVKCSETLKNRGYQPKLEEDSFMLSFIDQNNEYRVLLRGEDIVFTTLSYAGIWTCKSNNEIFLLYKNASLLNYNTTIGKICVFENGNNYLSRKIYVMVDTISSEFENSFETLMDVIQNLNYKFSEYMKRDLDNE